MRVPRRCRWGGCGRSAAACRADRADGEGKPRLEPAAPPDRLFGGPGADELEGGDGDDVIDARDGAGAEDDLDTIRCGPGEDTVLVDEHEECVFDCEGVRLP